MSNKFVAGLPGALMEDDPELDTPKHAPGKNRGPQRAESPSKRTKAESTGAVAVTVETLQMLLAQQSASLLEAQNASLKETLMEHEKRQDEKLSRLDAKVEASLAKSNTMEDQLRTALDRIKALEDKGVPGGSGGDQRRTSLVFGGWAENTRRNVILHQLSESLSHLKLNHLLDSDPFTTGPRRAVALCNFTQRSSESPPELRRRMLELVQEINKADLALQGGRRNLWCSFSRSPAERGRASVAGCVKKIVAHHRATHPSELDLDYAAGAAWMGDMQLAGMGASTVSNTTSIETRAGPAWIDEIGLSKTLKVSRQTIEDEVKQHRAALDDFPRKVAEAVGGSLQEADLLLLQELPRSAPGWQQVNFDQWKIVGHRCSDQWRGTGIMYHTAKWNVMRRLQAPKGTWFRLRHRDFGTEVWVGSVYLRPDLSQDEHAVSLQEFLQKLPATQLPVLVSGDSNSEVCWADDTQGECTPLGRNGKTVNLLHWMSSRGLRLVPPRPDQLSTPSTQPRQQDRCGRQIDFLAAARMGTSRVSILPGSNQVLGTDHDVLTLQASLRHATRRPRTDTRPRQLLKPLPPVREISQEALVEMAKSHTGPKQGRGYKDPEDVKALFRMARFSRESADWKVAFQSRRKARSTWERCQLEAAVQGDWGAFKKFRKQTKNDWELGFADAHDDPHQTIHDHLQNIYKSDERVSICTPTGDFVPITMDELKSAVQKGKRGVSVSQDGTSQELLLGIMNADGGAVAMQEWFNRLLSTGDLPDDWYRWLMVVLPKTACPTLPRELRPICMSSAISKTFCRILLERAKRGVQAMGPCQLAGPHKQTCDYVFCAHRLMSLDHEWGAGFAYLKVDIEKAFDCVSRVALCDYLESKLGRSHELRIWQLLLSRTFLSLETSWGASEIEAQRGIRQGSVESPLFFSCLAELTLESAALEHQWPREDMALPGLRLSEMMFVDDAVLWNSRVATLGQRVAQWAEHLARCGLRINLLKCELYISPHNHGPREITVMGEKLVAKDTLTIMGLPMKVKATTCELLAGLLARARDVFWSMKKLLCSSTPLHARIRLMDKVVAGCGLWCISSFFPEDPAMHMVNTFQLQLIMSMMNLKRGADIGWLDFRKQARRAARAALWQGRHKRWSTVWAERHWSSLGHLARSLLHPVPSAAALMCSYRTREWWTKEKTKKDSERVKHPKAFYARLMLSESKLDTAAEGPWRILAQDRVRWAGRLPAWVELVDVQWASGRQLALN
ncbi:unnamed protein product [Symbiodinium sp. CCMP2592]|nr:unnamed protein product [Symbiodinium sp. CCMP2592]